MKSDLQNALLVTFISCPFALVNEIPFFNFMCVVIWLAFITIGTMCICYEDKFEHKFLYAVIVMGLSYSLLVKILQMKG